MDASRSSDSKSRIQVVLEQMVSDELSYAMFESQKVLEEICPFPKRTLNSIMAHMRTGYGETDPLKMNFHRIKTGNKLTWNPCLDPSAERPFYVPFANMLNRIIDSYTAKCADAVGILRGLRFSVYDREMADRVEDSAPLKPDIVGCKFSVKSDRAHKVCWNEVMVPGELKSNWKDMILQSGTYARAVFDSRANRTFVVTIAYNHQSGELRFLFFHRGGLVMTPVLKICENADDFSKFVHGICGMLSWPTLEKAGMLPYRNDRDFFLGRHGLWQVDDTMCKRVQIRGRATRVHLISPVSGSSSAASGSGSDVQVQGELAGSGTAGPSSAPMDSVAEDERPIRRLPIPRAAKLSRIVLSTQKKSRAQKAKMIVKNLLPAAMTGKRRKAAAADDEDEDDERDVAVPVKRSKTSKSGKGVVTQDASTRAAGTSSLPIGVVLDQSRLEVNEVDREASKRFFESFDLGDDVPPRLVVKESWGRPDFDEMEVIRATKAAGADFGLPEMLGSVSLGDNSRFSISDCKHVKDGTLKTDDPVPFETRVHRWLFSKTVGQHLSKARSPRQLGTAIVHAMIGMSSRTTRCLSLLIFLS